MAAAGWLENILVNFGVKDRFTLRLVGELLLSDLDGMAADGGDGDSVSFQNLSGEESVEKSPESSVF